MAKHRKTTRLNSAVPILSLFLGVLFLLSLFSFVSIENSNPFAITPNNGQNIVPATPANTTGVPTPAQQLQTSPQIVPSSRAINAPAPTIPAQNASGTQKNVIPSSNNPLPLPLPTLPPVPSTKPLLKLDNGVEVNVPLLNLGVTVAPLKK